ncbi:MAG: hypothetical protein PG981_001248 [Wolbachia endosymbiont of Ctenocephalides orientis wCori]|nr:MAG: hypothetical protein PG981_001248 [Wolbachia endosymbiont of Ctenocephalides orientis wCori]
MTRYVPENANSDPELGMQSTPPTTAITEGIPLDDISVGSISLVSSSSPGSSPLYGNSRSPSPISFSLSTNSHGGENVPMAQARTEVSPLIDVLVEDVSPASRPLPGNSRSSSPTPS